MHGCGDRQVHRVSWQRKWLSRRRRRKWRQSRERNQKCRESRRTAGMGRWRFRALDHRLCHRRCRADRLFKIRQVAARSGSATLRNRLGSRRDAVRCVPYANMEAAVAHAFDGGAQFRFHELGDRRGNDAIMLALKPEYSGDRVFAFGVGFASTVFLSYNGETVFYLTDSLDPQKLYNSAGNIEIAAWKLANARNARGELLLVSNEKNRRCGESLFRARVRKDDCLSRRDGGGRHPAYEPNDQACRSDASDSGFSADLAVLWGGIAKQKK